MPSCLHSAQVMYLWGLMDQMILISLSQGPVVGHDGELSRLLYTAKTRCGCHQTVVKVQVLLSVGRPRENLNCTSTCTLHHTPLNLKTSVIHLAC